MSGFLTALFLCVCAGVLFLKTQPSSLLTDGPIASPSAVTEVASIPATTNAVMR